VQAESLWDADALNLCGVLWTIEGLACVDIMCYLLLRRSTRLPAAPPANGNRETVVGGRPTRRTNATPALQDS